MHLSVVLALLLGGLIAATPTQRENDLEVADEGIDEEDPDYADDTEDEDEREDYMKNDQEDESQEDEVGKEDYPGFTCTGRNATTPDGTTIKYTDPYSCHHWYECLGGTEIRYGCNPSHWVFSESRQFCLGGIECTPYLPFSCDGRSDGNYPDRTNCGQFITCSGGIKRVMPCPGGLHYNPLADQCDFPSVANCRSRENSMK